MPAPALTLPLGSPANNSANDDITNFLASMTDEGGDLTLNVEKGHGELNHTGLDIFDDEFLAIVNAKIYQDDGTTVQVDQNGNEIYNAI